MPQSGSFQPSPVTNPLNALYTYPPSISQAGTERKLPSAKRWLRFIEGTFVLSSAKPLDSMCKYEGMAHRAAAQRDLGLLHYQCTFRKISGPDSRGRLDRQGVEVVIERGADGCRLSNTTLPSSSNPMTTVASSSLPAPSRCPSASKWSRPIPRRVTNTDSCVWNRRRLATAPSHRRSAGAAKGVGGRPR